MRQQRRASRTVILRSTTTSRDKYGNESTSKADTTIHGAIYEPERVVESVNPDEPPVRLSAVFNLPGVHSIDSDDVIVDNGTAWAVNGEAQVWLDRTKVPVTATRAVATEAL